VHNNKHFCLHCFKSFKNSGKCCNWPLLEISHCGRPPKLRDGKVKWRQFFQIYLHGAYANKGQLKRIIEIKKEYGLPTLDQENQLEKMVIDYEEQFTIFDIKRHECFTVKYDNVLTDNIRNLSNLITDQVADNTKIDYVTNREYYLVPLTGGRSTYFDTIAIPTKKGYFGIYKARRYVDRSKNSVSPPGFEWHIKTGTKKEIIKELFNGMGNSDRYSYRQNFAVFESKEEAMAFRQKFLTLLFPVLKKEGIDYLDDVVKTVNVDFNRVSRKAPELLI
jgi:hypothetical protein